MLYSLVWSEAELWSSWTEESAQTSPLSTLQRVNKICIITWIYIRGFILNLCILLMLLSWIDYNLTDKFLQLIKEIKFKDFNMIVVQSAKNQQQGELFDTV